MKPKTFVIMPFKVDYNQLYSDVVRPELERCGFVVVRADELPGSSDMNQDITDGIREASLIIVEASELNANVYFEFGFSVATGKEFLLLAKRGTDLPFDTRRWRHLLYEPEHLNRLRPEFGSWIEGTNAFSVNADALNSRLSRGELFPNIVDACVSVQSNPMALQKRILDEIRSGSMLSCAYAYFTDSGSEHWLRLCNDPLYTVFQDSVRLLKKEASRIFASMGDAFIKQSPDFLSLGPGNGQKDRVLLRALFQQMTNQTLSPQVFYYPFDISHAITSTAVHTVCNDQQLRSQLRIKALMGDFTTLQDFRPVYTYRSAPNIFSFLGNTLGNISQEVVFLQRLKTAMIAGDILLLEVRLRIAAIEAGGQDYDQIGLSFAPLTRLGIQFDISRIHKREESSVSQIRGTKTLAVHYRDIQVGKEHFPDVFLSCVNYYDPEELRRTLEGTTLDFDILDAIESELMVIFVVRKK